MANRVPISPRTALISAREAAGMSRNALAAKLGHTAHFVTMVENGRQYPSIPVMHNWLALLGATSLDLFRRNQASPDLVAKSIKAIKQAKDNKRRAIKSLKTAAA